LSLGFSTENIINRIHNSDWDVVLIYKSEQVIKDELQALQKYSDHSGTIFIDYESLKRMSTDVNYLIQKKSKL